MEIYVVKQKDNVDQIARDFHIPVERLIRDNQLEYPYRLAVGQALLIMGDNPAGEKKRKGKISMLLAMLIRSSTGKP